MNAFVYILCLIGFLLLMCLLLFKEMYMKKKYMEGLKMKVSDQKYVMLMGDSILNNSNYVSKNGTVEKKLKKRSYKVFNYAEDNAIISDIDGQLEKIHELSNKHKRRLNKQGILVLSIGGNDLLEKYEINNNSDNSIRRGNITEIWDDYKSIVTGLEEDLHEMKYTNLKIALVGLYLPVDNKYRKYEKIVRKWNKKVLQFSEKDNNRLFIDLYEPFNQDEYFVDKIEPSEKGSEIIASKIDGLYK